MGMQAMNNRVSKLNAMKKDIAIEIEQIQSECAHPNEPVIKQIVDANGSVVIRIICPDCRVILKYPNPSELHKFLNS